MTVKVHLSGSQGKEHLHNQGLCLTSEIARKHCNEVNRKHKSSLGQCQPSSLQIATVYSQLSKRNTWCVRKKDCLAILPSNTTITYKITPSMARCRLSFCTSCMARFLVSWWADIPQVIAIHVFHLAKEAQRHWLDGLIPAEIALQDNKQNKDLNINHD